MNAPQQLAAPAPDVEPEDGEPLEGLFPEASAKERALDDRLDELFEQLVWWCRTRRYYGKASVPPSLLGRLAKRTRPLRESPDAECSPELAALYIAVIQQPLELDRRVFELHYFHRVVNIKLAADAMGISRRHWYRLLIDFRRKAYAASREVLAANEAALAQLQSRRTGVKHEGETS